MALNPPISQAGVPLRVEGEYMILERKEIETEINIQGLGKKKGKGKLFLTTVRMVFVNKDFINQEFKSFDIPLALMANEAFEQPIFGANYLKGKVAPLFNLIPGIAEFKLWFMSGGCQTFLNYFLGVLKEVRRSRGVGQHNQNFLNQVQSGRFMQNQAFIDPNDPSVMFVTQPEQTYNNTMNQQGNQQYYGQNFEQNFQQQQQQQQSNVPTTFVDFSNKNINQNNNNNNQQQPQQQPNQYQQQQQFQQPSFQQPQFQQPQFQQQQFGGFQQFSGKGVQIGGSDQQNNFNQNQQQQQQPQQQVQQGEGFDYPKLQNPQQQQPNQFQMDDAQIQQQQQFQQNQQQMYNNNQNQNLYQQNMNQFPQQQQQMQQQQQQQQQQQNQVYPNYEAYQQQQQRMNQAFYFGIPIGPQLQRNQYQQ